MNPIETIKLNVEGEICPYSLIRILKKIKEVERELSEGRILEVITDHSPAVENIPTELKRRRFQIEYEKIEYARWRVLIRR